MASEHHLPAATDPHAQHDHAGAGDQVVRLAGLRWSDWVRLTEAKGESCHPKFAYLDGVLELRKPSRHHERTNAALGRLIETWCLERGVDVVPLGSWTLESRDRNACVEPCECYQIGAEERSVPDVAIEVVWTSGSIDKLEIYRRLGVPEVWFWRQGAMHVYVLGEDAYSEVAGSVAFPGIDLALILSLISESTTTEAQLALIRHLRAESR